MTEAATTVTAVLPLWLEIIVALLVLAGAGLALLGSTGLLRLPTFFERVHAPAIIATLGCWLIMHGTVLYFSVADRSLALHALLIAVFVAVAVALYTSRDVASIFGHLSPAAGAAPRPETDHAEMKRELAEVFTREMARICGCSESAIHIVFDDIKKQDWAIGGQLLHDKAQG